MNMQIYEPNFYMQSHFSRVAAAYREIRTTDVEPIFFIKEKLKERDCQIGADIGCGGGRYDRLLLDHLPLSHLFCLDANPDMVKQAHRFLCETRAGNFSTSVSMSELLPFKNRSLDCVFTFNAVHHFVFEEFLRETGRALKHLGRLFIYTRLPAQNEVSIWGEHFPEFTEKETRLFELEHMKGEIRRQSALVLEEIKYFRYQRVSSLERLLSQVRERHYSTFSLYTSKELEEAVEGFKGNILAAFPDPDHLEWTDGNVMLVLRRMHPNLHVADFHTQEQT
jgi:SAM-dependent methyltransferase